MIFTCVSHVQTTNDNFFSRKLIYWFFVSFQLTKNLVNILPEYIWRVTSFAVKSNRYQTKCFCMYITGTEKKKMGRKLLYFSSSLIFKYRQTENKLIKMIWYSNEQHQTEDDWIGHRTKSKEYFWVNSTRALVINWTIDGMLAAMKIIVIMSMFEPQLSSQRWS